MQLELSGEEAQFLYNLLDSVAMKGIQAKGKVLTLMVRLVELAPEASGPVSEEEILPVEK